MVAHTLSRVGTAVVGLAAGTNRVVGRAMTSLPPPGHMNLAAAALLTAAVSLRLWPN